MEEWIVKEHLKPLLHEDIGYEDLTTNILSDKGRCLNGEVIAKEEFILSGVNEAKVLFNMVDVSVITSLEGGDPVKPGETIMNIEGKASSILMVERLALNIIMRMSGIATKVHKMKEKAGDTIIAGTRKTTPGFRYFEKRAIKEGGGDPHRFRLDDMVLIKDNHITMVGTLEEAIRLAKDRSSFSKKIDVEVKNVDEAVRAAEAGADIVMLDNMSLEDCAEAYSSIKEVNDAVLVEISGGLDESNIESYSKYCDIISSGALTHSVKSADVSLKISNPD